MTADLYEGCVDIASDGLIVGWARRLDTDDPVTVAVFAGDSVVTWGVAANFRSDLLGALKGEGNHGFELQLPAGTDMGALRVVAGGSDNFLLPMPPPVLVAPPAARREAAPQSDRRGRLLIDLTDIIFHVAGHDSLSGIQRVQHELLRHIGLLYKPREIVYCATMDGCPHYVEVPVERVMALVRDAGNLSDLSAARRNILRDTGWIETADRLAAAPDDILISPSHFWGFPGIPERLAALKKQGVAIVVLIYDLLPISDPDYFVPDLTELFGSSFNHLSYVADRFLTISDYTAGQVAQIYRDSGREPISIESVPLAHQSVAAAPKLPKNQLSGALATAVEHPFILSVGTIEARKNHAYLFRIWRDLLEKHGPDKIPRLVLVGRRGWKVDELFQQLARTNFLNGHVLLLSSVSDTELAQLYHYCLFTMFPSFGEGWGLPVGESLAYGKACIASEAGSIPEVGGDHVLYCDPHYPRDGLAKVEALLFDRGRLAAMEERLRRFSVRSWKDVAERFFRYADIRSATCSAEPPFPRQEFPVPSVPYGRLVGVGRRTMRPGSSPLSMMFVEGWHDWTDDVVWAKAKVTVLRFAVIDRESGDSAPAAPYRLSFLMTVAPDHPSRRITVREGLANRQQADCAGGRDVLITLSMTGVRQRAMRVFEVEIDSSVEAPESPSLGLKALAVIGADDLEARLTVMEDLLMSSGA